MSSPSRALSGCQLLRPKTIFLGVELSSKGLGSDHLETMGGNEEVRKSLRSQIEQSQRANDEEMEFWNQTTMCKPLSTMTYLRQSCIGRGGSRPGECSNPGSNIDHERASSHERILQDYFRENPTFDNKRFRWRNRMRRPLFWKIHDVVCAS